MEKIKKLYELLSEEGIFEECAQVYLTILVIVLAWDLFVGNGWEGMSVLHMVNILGVPAIPALAWLVVMALFFLSSPAGPTKGK